MMSGASLSGVIDATDALCVGSLHANARHARRRCRWVRGCGVSRRARLGCVLRLPDRGRGPPLDRGRNGSMQRRTAGGAEPRDRSRDRPHRTPWGAHHHLEQPARLDVRFVSVKPARPRLLTRHPRQRHTRPDELAGSLGLARAIEVASAATGLALRPSRALREMGTPSLLVALDSSTCSRK